MAILHWFDAGIPGARLNTHTYFGGDVITEPGGIWAITTAGTTAGSPPTWTPPTVTDGTAVWTKVLAWAAATPYVAFNAVVPTTPSGRAYVVDTPGTSGDNEPVWPIGGGVDDVEGDGGLVPPDGTDNDSGTGSFLGALESTYLWQVWPNPAIDRDGAPLGVLTQAYDRKARIVFSNTGEASLTINRHAGGSVGILWSTQAVNDWLADTAYSQGDLVVGAGLVVYQCVPDSESGTSGAVPPSWDPDADVDDNDLTWHPVRRWQPAYHKANAALVQPTVADGFAYMAGADGLTAATEPTWPAVADETVQDGSLDDEVSWLDKDRIVVLYRESLDNAPCFGWILETETMVAVSPDEDGGDTISWAGRGVMAETERASLYHESYLSNGADLRARPQDDRDGQWHWTDRPPAAILVRQLEEARARGDIDGGSGSQDSPMPNVYWTFTRHRDSVSAAWDDSAGAMFKLPVGDNLFRDVLPKLMQVGLLLRALPVINADGHLRTQLTAWADDPGVNTGIIFRKGEDIVESGEKQVDTDTGYTDVLVAGDLQPAPGGDVGTTVYVARHDATFRAAVGRREGFLPFGATQHVGMLAKAGDRLIRQGRRKHDGPTTLQLVESEGKVAFVDFFPGDYVTVDIPGVWDNYEDNVDEILLSEDGGTGYFALGIQFADDDPVGVTGISVDNCACSTEPPPTCE